MAVSSSSTLARVPRRLLVLGLALVPSMACAELDIVPGTAPYTTSVGRPTTGAPPTTAPPTTTTSTTSTTVGSTTTTVAPTTTTSVPPTTTTTTTPPTTTPPTTTPPGPTSGIITTIAGDGTTSLHGDGGPAVDAGMFWASEMAVGPDGSIYVSHFLSHVVRRILPDGTIVNFAGTGTQGSAGDGGDAVDAQLNHPVGLAVDGDGNVYISDHYNHTVRKVDTDGTITRIAGVVGEAGYNGDGIPATSAKLNETEGLAIDNQGRLLLADFSNHRIRRIEHDGTISTIAGNGTAGNTSGPATSSGLYTPAQIAVHSDGTIYVVSGWGDQIRRIDTNGNLSTFAGSNVEGYADGTGTAAQFNGPDGLAIDGAGNLYVADSVNRRVRRITPAGVVTTVALNGDHHFTGDGGPALQAGGYVVEVDIDQQGRLLLADNGHHRVRRVG